ncbi:anhydro-N-acetylmuramic acid kinase [Paraglaciecola polaris]|uniref:anhydro-N-acetylmuramic acid kinase n=1 Tax=Paraglaciecola polaris TaxID=222814 RepID=UPI00129AF7DB
MKAFSTPYFALPALKSTGRELFNKACLQCQVALICKRHPNYLVIFTAKSIALHIE